MSAAPTWNIAQAARALGVSSMTLHRMKAEGLLPTVQRSKRGWHHVELALIKKLAASLPAGGTNNQRAERLRMLLAGLSVRVEAPEETVSGREAARLLGVNAGRISEWVADGTLRTFRSQPGAPQVLLLADVKDLGRKRGLTQPDDSRRRVQDAARTHNREALGAAIKSLLHATELLLGIADRAAKEAKP